MQKLLELQVAADDVVDHEVRHSREALEQLLLRHLALAEPLQLAQPPDELGVISAVALDLRVAQPKEASSISAPMRLIVCASCR
jgi:hypothetical protein